MKKRILYSCILLAAIVLGIIVIPVVTLAADIRGGESVTVPKGETVDGDLYIAGNNIIIEGTVNGDIFAAAQTITISGPVKGGVSVAGQTINISGDIQNGARVAGQTITVSGSIGRDLVVAGSNVTVTGSARIANDLFLATGGARVDGMVGGNLKGGASNLTVNGSIKGNVNVQVDTMTVGSGAIIDGTVTYTSSKQAVVQSGAKTGAITRKEPPAQQPRQPFRGVGVAGRVFGYLAALATGIVLILLAPSTAVSIADGIRRKPWASLGWGMVIFFITPLVAIVLLITVVGIPVAVILFLTYCVAMYLTQVFVGILIGRMILYRNGGKESRPLLIGGLALGLLILVVLGSIPFLNFITGLATALLGLGALFTFIREPQVPAAPVSTT